MAASYAIGIDLGTTHSALAYVDLDLSEGDAVALHVKDIGQHVGVGQIEDKKLLPSFLYLPHAAELTPGALALPWAAESSEGAFTVGELARQLGAKTPMRLVSSAKSWLGHGGVDRRAPILPPKAMHDEGDVARISPLEASTRYLSHLRQAWDHAHPEAPLAEQDVVITVPASFDPGARELTSEAARLAGLEHAVLLEEPQAALYAWVQRSEGGWRKQVKVGDVILVVDLGGGTSDMSLIAVTEEGGNLTLSRVAVGDHILLGGDNMDLALAAFVQKKLEGSPSEGGGGHKLDAWQIGALVHACRGAKETLLAEGGPSAAPIVVPTRGSKLVGGSLRTELTQKEIADLLVEGFFPVVASSDRPVSRPRTGLRAIGLPYAQDAGITRHLAAFLGKQIDATEDLAGFTKSAGTFLHPTAVLFNGGVLKADPLARRVLEVLNQWLEADGAPKARLLEGADLDLAVARGAAYYAYVRRGKGVRIRGGTAKSYYVGIESSMPAVPGMEPPLHALCIAPFGMEEGTSAAPAPQELGLVVGEHVSFRFFESATRRDDQPGAVVDRIDALEELPSIEATLPVEPSAGHRDGDIVPVRLQAAVTELGTLRLEAIGQKPSERWKIELDVRR
ncbi:MAG: Hsp70 family protein [Deltaproteobacteria bacterium]|nr:Hsp70 family protein [Deltaproteobacteria bacterium]